MSIIRTVQKTLEATALNFKKLCHWESAIRGAILFLAALFVVDFGRATQPDPVYTVDFSTEHSLKPVFDSGLRPKQISEMEVFQCEVKDKFLQFVLSAHVSLKIRAENVAFSVYEDDNIGALTAVTRSLSLDEAFAAAAAPYRALGGDLEDLRYGLNQVAKDPLSDAADELGIRKIANLTEVRVGFLRAPYVGELPGWPVRLAISVVWMKTRYKARVRTDPITSPQGYEDISMAPEAPEIEFPFHLERADSLAISARHEGWTFKPEYPTVPDFQFAPILKPFTAMSAADDFDGDAISNFDEFLLGTDLTDYNGVPPAISILSGDGQRAPVSSCFYNPLTVEIKNSLGQPFADARVTFQIETAGGFLNDQQESRRVTVLTNEWGYASIRLNTPSVPGASIVTAILECSGSIHQVTFSAHAFARPTTRPNAPTNLVETKNPDGSSTLTWEDNSGDESYFEIRRQLPDGSFEVIATVGPNQTSFTIPAPALRFR